MTDPVPPSRYSDSVAANRRLWDRWTEMHADSPFYDAEAFRAGASTLCSIELEELGEVAGKSLLHLQCHFGLDTLSWARRGARVTGVDLSPRAIQRARRLAAEVAPDLPPEAGEPRFLCADVLDLPAELDGVPLAGAFDVVFTSYGVLWWLPDLAAWARTVARCLRPGGTFYVVEFHPVTVAADEAGAIAWDYFRRGDEPVVDEAPPSYATPEAGGAEGEAAHGWPYPLGEVVTALLAAGLRLELLHEHDWSPWPCAPFTVEAGPGRWTAPGAAAHLPHLFSLRAVR